MLEKYGHDVMFINETHDMNLYYFNNNTLVHDDMREGFPCAFMISNHIDEAVLTINRTIVAQNSYPTWLKVFPMHGLLK